MSEHEQRAAAPGVEQRAECWRAVERALNRYLGMIDHYKDGTEQLDVSVHYKATVALERLKADSLSPSSWAILEHRDKECDTFRAETKAALGECVTLRGRIKTQDAVIASQARLIESRKGIEAWALEQPDLDANNPSVLEALKGLVERLRAENAELRKERQS